MIWRQKNQLSNGTTTLVPAEGVYLLDGQLILVLKKRCSFWHVSFLT